MEENKSNEISLKIDDVQVSVPKGTNLIEAAEKAGIYIPHFCYHEGLSVVGQCRMCFVEIEGARKLATACSTSVAPDMIVSTKSEEVVKSQNATIEFILLNHPLDCPICDRGGECKLQDYTLEYGPSRSRMTDDKVLRDKHRALSKDIYLDQERCILCTRCTRFSSEVDGKTELVVTERGNDSRIDVFEDKEFASNFSGNVVDLCPVGALTAKDFRFQARPWELEKHDVICTGCAVGCNAVVETKHRHAGIVRPDKKEPVPEIKRLLPRKNSEVNDWWLCNKGRWGYHFHNEAERRVKTPLLLRDGNYEEVGLQEIQRELEKDLFKKDISVFVSDSLCGEAVEWTQDLRKSWRIRGRNVSGINESPVSEKFLDSWGNFKSEQKWNALPADWNGIQEVYSLQNYRDLETQVPLLSLRLGQKRRSKKLKWNELKSYEEFSTLEFSEDAVLLLPVPQKMSEIELIETLNKKHKILFLWSNVNSRGVLEQGIAPLELISEFIEETEEKAIFFVHQETQNDLPEKVQELLKNASTLFVADSHNKNCYQNANGLLPLTPLYETQATLCNLEGLSQLSDGIQIEHPNSPSLQRGGRAVPVSLRVL